MSEPTTINSPFSYSPFPAYKDETDFIAKSPGNSGALTQAAKEPIDLLLAFLIAFVNKAILLLYILEGLAIKSCVEKPCERQSPH